MSQLDEAVAKYNKLLESGPYRDLAWVEALHATHGKRESVRGRTVWCALFCVPTSLPRRQYESLVKTGEALIAAIDRMERMVLANPALLARLELLPAEKMLAAIDPGYQALEVSARLDAHLFNGSSRVVQYNADSPTGAGYADALADLFYDAPPVKEFPRIHRLYGRRKPAAVKDL